MRCFASNQSQSRSQFQVLPQALAQAQLQLQAQLCRGLFCLWILLSVCSLATGQRSPNVAVASPAHPALAITNVNLVDLSNGNILYRHTIVLRDGKIVGIARVGLLNIGKNLQVINGSGKYLIPGLWDMHVHLTGVETRTWTEDVILPQYLAHGVVGVRDMGGDFSILRGWGERVESGALTGPHIVTPGPFLDALAANSANTIAVRNGAEARTAVDQLRAAGVNFIKVLSPPREAYFAILAEAKRVGLPVVGHVPEGVSAVEASDAGQKSIEHLSGILLAASVREVELAAKRNDAIARGDSAGLQQVRQQTYDSFDPAKLRAVLKHFHDNGTWQVPTLIWTKTMSEIDSPRWVNDERMKQVPAWARPAWDAKKMQQQTTPQALDLQRHVLARYMAIVGEMKPARVPLLAGTDSPDPFVFPGSSLHEELELLVASGLSPLDALRAATTGPATFLADSEHSGYISVGQAADLVLLEGNPLEDIRNTRKIAGVLMRGRYYSRLELDKMLAKSAEAAAREK